MEKLNAIVIDGKVYELVESKEANPCIDCALVEECLLCAIIDFCIQQGNSKHFRYSQSLTDKLNK